MSTHEKLLPCPFCGGEARMHPNNWLSCTLCNIFTDIHDTQSEALAHWNSRASPPAAVPEGWAEPAAWRWRIAGGRIWVHSSEKPEPGKYFNDDIVVGRDVEVEPLYAHPAVISAAPAAPNGWRSVRDDPPPKDGSWILATNIGWHGDCEVLGWHFGAWRRTPDPESGECSITHWQPLPAAPTEASDE